MAEADKREINEGLRLGYIQNAALQSCGSSARCEPILPVNNVLRESDCVIAGCVRWAGVLVMQRAIFYYGSLHREEEEFLFALCAGHEEFDRRDM